MSMSINFYLRTMQISSPSIFGQQARQRFLKQNQPVNNEIWERNIKRKKERKENGKIEGYMIYDLTIKYTCKCK